MPAAPRPGRRDLGGHRDGRVGALVGAQLQSGPDQGEPLGLHGHGSLALEQGQDGFERLFHHVALLGRVDAHHERVRGEGTGADTDHEPAPGQVIEQDQAVGQDEGVVVGEGGHPGAEPDVPGALCGGGDEDLG